MDLNWKSGNFSEGHHGSDPSSLGESTAAVIEIRTEARRDSWVSGGGRGQHGFERGCDTERMGGSERQRLGVAMGSTVLWSEQTDRKLKGA